MKKVIILMAIIISAININAQKIGGAGVTFVGKIGIKDGNSCFPMLWMCKVKKIKVKCKIKFSRYDNARMACPEDEVAVDELDNERIFYFERVDGDKMRIHFLTPIPTEHTLKGYFEGTQDIIFDPELAAIFGVSSLTLKAGKYKINEHENSWGYFDIDFSYN